jgi:hypothetical protein
MHHARRRLQGFLQHWKNAILQQLKSFFFVHCFVVQNFISLDSGKLKIVSRKKLKDFLFFRVDEEW